MMAAMHGRMFTNPPSSRVVVSRLEQFTPPYCPNSQCPWHARKNADGRALFHRHGKVPTKKFPYASPRFRCTKCGRAFTASFFRLDYRDQERDTYEEIFRLRQGGFSKRQVADALGQSLDTVLRRLQKLARQGLLRLAQDTQSLKITEEVAFDGIENFSFSQFDPNNVNHAVGRSSLFLYDFNYCHINRKGKMSPWQAKRKVELEKIHGKYPVRAIEACSKRIFERLLAKCPKGLTLHTDNHFLYRAAILSMRGQNRVGHYITPGKAARTYKNRLFAINHFDMLTRHHLADYKRETIAFAKTSQSMVESFVLLGVQKNYMRPKFVKPQVSDPAANVTSPAMYLGLAGKILTFREFFRIRITKHQVALSDDWLALFERRDPFSRRRIRAYEGI